MLVQFFLDHLKNKIYSVYNLNYYEVIVKILRAHEATIKLNLMN